MNKLDMLQMKANELNDVKEREQMLKEDNISSEDRKRLKEDITTIKNNYIKLQVALEDNTMEL